MLCSSLTRKVGPVLTCSCGYPSAVNARHTVPREFCSMLPRDEDAPYYTLNCVNDLDEGDEEMVRSGYPFQDGREGQNGLS